MKLDIYQSSRSSSCGRINGPVRDIRAARFTRIASFLMVRPISRLHGVHIVVGRSRSRPYLLFFFGKHFYRSDQPKTADGRPLRRGGKALLSIKNNPKNGTRPRHPTGAPSRF
jgi:hypothetical protein